MNVRHYMGLFMQLLDACINNCGRKFHLEVASRDFESELRNLLTNTRTHHKVSKCGADVCPLYKQKIVLVILVYNDII